MEYKEGYVYHIKDSYFEKANDNKHFLRQDLSMLQRELSEAELNAELEKGYADMVAGKIKPARQAFADIRKDYSV